MRTDIRGGPALFRVVRYWSRRWAAGPAPEGQVGHVLILEAIDAARRDGTAQIADVAVELGLDRSNASRMLAAAVDAGLVTKTVSAHDARRTELGISPEGEDLLRAARDWQEETYARMTAGWPPADARRFAAYLVRLASEQHLEER